MSGSEPIRILYMEDDQGLARLVKKRLEKAGYSIDIAYDGKNGLDKYDAGSYDILAVDQTMPVYDGLKVLSILTSRGPLPPTIMITGTGDENLAVEAMRMGAMDYIIKDVEGRFLELLPFVIDQMLFKNRLEEGKKRAVQALRESEEKYRTLFELATDAFLTIIPNGEICDVNEAAVKLLGYSREELKELTIWQIFAPEVAEEAYCEWKRQVKDKGYFVMETFWAHYNGAQIPVIVSGRSVRLQGKAQFHIIAHDITELRRTEQALCESEKKYRELVENLHEGIWVIDKDGFTTFVNPHMADMLGYTVDEMKGMHLFSFMNKHGIEACKTNLERRRQGIKGRQDLEFLRKDGKRVYVSMETSPLTDDNGNYIGAITGVMDITERKRENEALASTNARLKYLLRSSPAVIYSCEAHRNYSIIYISENISAQLGYTPQEILSDPKFWLDHIHSEDISKVLEAHNEVIKKGYSIHEYRFLHKDGTYRWFHDESKIVKDADGNPTEIVGYLLDITGKKSTD